MKTRVYEDTKIKLHFSHFKVLDGKRETCFREEPHCCKDLCEGKEADPFVKVFEHAAGGSEEL